MALLVSRRWRTPLGLTGIPEADGPESSPGGDDARSRTDGADPPPGGTPVDGLSRRGLALLVGVLIVLWLVVVVGRALSEGASGAARVEELRRETAAAAARLEAERRELELVQTPAYSQLVARAYGYGRPGERVFALDQGAPAPRRIVPLGDDPADLTARAPLDDWLALLFGP